MRKDSVVIPFPAERIVRIRRLQSPTRNDLPAIFRDDPVFLGIRLVRR